jgi:hypothetical protein
MAPHRTLTLEFHPVLDDARGRKELRDGLSTVATVGRTLWVADDESASVERLTLRGDTASEHVQFAVDDFVALPSPRKGGVASEIDVEGLACADGYLWLSGSHSMRRCAVDPAEPKAAKRLARTEPQDNRFLLARIPLETRDGLPVPVRRSRPRRAQRLAGDHRGNTLTRLLREDPHLAPFIGLPVPVRRSGPRRAQRLWPAITVATR